VIKYFLIGSFDDVAKNKILIAIIDCLKYKLEFDFQIGTFSVIERRRESLLENILSSIPLVSVWGAENSVNGTDLISAPLLTLWYSNHIIYLSILLLQ
jgi:hypothetical protein